MENKTKRVFIAIELPDAIKEKVSSIQNDIRIGNISPVSKEKMHITLFFFGNINDEAIGKIKGILQGLNLAPFRISLNGISTFSRRRPNVIFAKISEGKDEVAKIHDSIHMQIGEIVQIESRKYEPHLTIARTHNLKRKAVIELNELMQINSDKAIGEFSCNSIKLIESKMEGQGHIYIDLYVKSFKGK